jgi:hypothetical protein
MVYLKIEDGKKVAYLTYEDIPFETKDERDEKERQAMESAIDIFESFSDLKAAHPDWEGINNKCWNPYSQIFV